LSKLEIEARVRNDKLEKRVNSKSAFRYFSNPNSRFGELSKKFIPTLSDALRFLAPFPSEGALMRRSDRGKRPAPAGAVRSRITGRLRVTVRAHYDALP
jgi:hypothetical protein